MPKINVSGSRPRRAPDETYTMSTQRDSFSGGVRRRPLGTARPAVLFELLRPVPYHPRLSGQVLQRTRPKHLQTFQRSK